MDRASHQGTSSESNSLKRLRNELFWCHSVSNVRGGRVGILQLHFDEELQGVRDGQAQESSLYRMPI